MTAEQKIIHMPGTVLTAEVCLHRTLTKIDHIKAVTIVIQWDDDTFDVDWSSMKSSALAMAALMIQKTATDIISGKEPDDA